MKKLLTLLVLVIVTGLRAQVYALEYTSFQLYNPIEHKYSEEYFTNTISFIDTDKKEFYLIHDQLVIFDVSIISMKTYDKTVAYKCIDIKTHKEWDIYIMTVDQYSILKSKSGDEGWIYKSKIN